MSLNDVLALFGIQRKPTTEPNQMDRFFRRRAKEPSVYDGGEDLFNVPLDHVFGEMDDLKRDFDRLSRDMFDGFESMEPGLHGPARMIPIESPARDQDRDLTDEVVKYGIDHVRKQIEREELQEKQHQPLMNDRRERAGSFFSFSSKVLRSQDLGDGIRSEYRSFVDSDGNKHEITTKTIGDRSYTVTDKTDPNGHKERVEGFQNMSETDLGDFEKQFNSGAANIRSQIAFRKSPRDHWENRPWRNYLIDNVGKWF